MNFCISERPLCNRLDTWLFTRNSSKVHRIRQKSPRSTLFIRSIYLFINYAPGKNKTDQVSFLYAHIGSLKFHPSGQNYPSGRFPPVSYDGAFKIDHIPLACDNHSKSTGRKKKKKKKKKMVTLRRHWKAEVLLSP